MIMKKRGGKIEESKVLDNLPPEVIYDIFVRLPIKDILRCRCVSKSWFSIISDPQFVRYHLSTAKRIDNLGSQRHIRIGINGSIESISYQTLQHENVSLSLPDVDETIECRYWYSFQPEWREFLCSCNGLVLIGRGDKDHFLWNPCIRSYKRIPRIPSDFSNYQYFMEDCIKMYGLGYDMLTDAYKVVRIVHILKPKLNSRLAFTARTYNCKTNCWKRISDFPYRIYRNTQGITVNGAPHWIVAREYNENEYVIIYFDVLDDTIEEIETPPPFSLGADCRLSTFEDSLCLVTNAERFSEVWVLQKSGGTEKWKKLFSIEKDMHKGNPRGWLNLYVDNFVPLCYRNDRILFEVRQKHDTCDQIYHSVKLLTYDLESKAHESVRGIHQRDANLFHSITYVESLVSPDLL